MRKFEARGVLAGAYNARSRGKGPRPGQVTRTHFYEVTQGIWGAPKTLCGRILAERLSDLPSEAADCPLCVERFQRLAAKEIAVFVPADAGISRDTDVRRDVTTKGNRMKPKAKACSCSHAKPAAKKARKRASPKRDASRKSPACGVGTEIQTLVLSQQFFTERQAEGWVRRHGFRSPKIDITPNNYRFRQHPPSNYQPGSFRTIRLRPGVEAVIGCPQ